MAKSYAIISRQSRAQQDKIDHRGRQNKLPNDCRTSTAKFMTMDRKKISQHTSQKVWIPPTQAGGYTARCDRASWVSKKGNRRWVGICWNQKRHVRLTTGMVVSAGTPGAMINNEYKQSKLTPRLWTHNTQPIQCCLVIDDFDIKYVNRENAEQKQCILEQHYEITTNQEGSKYVGLTLD